MEKSSGKNEDLSYKRGFKIGTIVGVIVIAAAFIIPTMYKKINGPDWQRIYDDDAKANLNNIFIACKAYWADNGSKNNCTPAIASQPEYGYIQSTDVTISANGAKGAFSAKAQNTHSLNKFSVTSEGTITEVD